MNSTFKRASMFGECASLGWGLWQCPPFLFIVMGFITIVSIIGASILSYRIFAEPEIPTILITSFIAALFLTVGNFIISGFNKVAESNRVKSQFISIVSHQLRSPVSIFKWTLEALEHAIKNPQMKTETDHYLESLAEATQKMIRIVNTLLDVTRIESHTLSLQKDNVSIADLAKKISKDFSRYAETSHVTLAVDVDEDILPLSTDRQRIQMVMETLIDNAIRYSTKGTVAISLKRDGASIRFTVRDSGIGIPAPQQKFIFQKFFRAANTLQYQTEGTGIDLYISHYIIEALGGGMYFTSEENKGSTFWFILPIK